MTALAEDRNDSRLSEGTIQGPFPVVGSDTIYKHALVCADANGYLVPASDTAALTHVQGIAVQQYENESGANGDVDARVMSGIAINLSSSGANQAWVGRDVFAVDDQTVALAATTTNDRLVGRVLRVISATEVVVFIPLGGNGG